MLVLRRRKAYFRAERFPLWTSRRYKQAENLVVGWAAGKNGFFPTLLAHPMLVMTKCWCRSLDQISFS